MTISVTGAAIGLMLGFGLYFMIFRIPTMRKVKLDDRLAPYVRDTVAPAGLDFSDKTFTPFPTLERILRPYVRRGATGLERVLGGGNQIRRRLRQAGSETSLEEFRIEQLVWGAGGFAIALAVAFLGLVSRGFGAIPLLIMAFGAFIGGVMLRDRQISVQIKKREQAMIAEFPTIADMLALSVAAGEGPVGALERVANTSKGELAKEFRLALAEARTGASLVEALEAVGDRTNLSLLARFVDGIAVAVERGTPLADVLRAQAADVREVGKRELIESGSKKEIGMMVPVVFFVLPVIILFAFYPGAIQLETFGP